VADTLTATLVHIGGVTLGNFDKKYDDERQVITILHVAFWVGERTIDQHIIKNSIKAILLL
jgi:hypothetical protein